MELRKPPKSERLPLRTSIFEGLRSPARDQRKGLSKEPALLSRTEYLHTKRHHLHRPRTERKTLCRLALSGSRCCVEDGRGTKHPRIRRRGCRPLVIRKGNPTNLARCFGGNPPKRMGQPTSQRIGDHWCFSQRLASAITCAAGRLELRVIAPCRPRRR